MRTRPVLVLSLALASAALAAAPEFEKAVADAAKLPHPRLFAAPADFARAKALARREGTVNAYAVRRALARADDLLDKPVLARIQTGRRLLAVSRQALYRISHLAMAWRLTGERKYLERGERELRAVCAFSDWNPSHFLDVGEMSFAVALGYDWLYDGLSDAARDEIAAGLNRLGLQAGLQPHGWKKMTNNWGQVCRGGLLAAALALGERHPADAADMLEECVRGLPKSMAALAPNGCYPEGPGYWNYGMSYNVYAIAMLEHACGTDFGLADQPGFRAAGAYPVMVTGPSGRTVGTSDTSDRRGENTVLWWFARRFAQPGVIGEKEIYAVRAPHVKGQEGWLPPLEVLWADPAVTKPAGEGLPLVWNPGGSVPVVIQRSSWRKDGAFVCLKGGSPSAPHGHMDGGNFILEMGGVRWAHELPCEEYNRLEQMGINLWGMDQKSTRWTLYRLNSEGHSVPSIDGALQAVRGSAKVVSVTDYTADGRGSAAKLDLSSLYPAAKSVVREGTLSGRGTSYDLVDTFTGLRPGAVVRWQMITRAEPSVRGPVLTLSEKGKAVEVRAYHSDIVWSVAPAEGPRPLNTPNDGAKVVSFTRTCREGVPAGELAFHVQFLLLDPRTGRPVNPDEVWRPVY